MSTEHLVAARRRAEEAVADMPEGPLKIKAFEVILSSLLSAGTTQLSVEPSTVVAEETRMSTSSSLAGRIDRLAEEGFFAEPKSLGEIQAKLGEHGWHYPQTNLSTPMIRLVRQRRLRRLQLANGNKRVWKYTLP